LAGRRSTRRRGRESGLFAYLHGIQESEQADSNPEISAGFATRDTTTAPVASDDNWTPRSLVEVPDQPVLLSYPDPPLTDGVLVLRRWTESDIGCVEEGSRDPDIPSGTIVPARFTPAEGLAWIERQWGRADKREGLSLAIADAGSG
jgi:hypothetical protein